MEPKTSPETPVRLAFISTGTVQIKSRMQGQLATNHGRLLRSFADSQWTGPLPIGVFLISHPDGPILFDTGESPRCNEPDFNSWLSPTKWFAKTQIGQDDGIVTQLRRLGVEPKDVQAIILSHLHGDHAGGLQSLAEEAPDVPVYVAADHWNAYGKHLTYAAIQGCDPNHWPDNFSPNKITFSDDPVGPWEDSRKMTEDGKIIAVPTPGHVPGAFVSYCVRRKPGRRRSNLLLDW